jgi:hypothetical protein
MPTSSFNKFHQFVEDLAHAKHDFSSATLEVALTAAANAPTAGHSILASLTQISYTNLPAADRVLSLNSSAQVSGSYTLVLGDQVLGASGGAVAAFRYVVLFNQSQTSPADPLIGWYDYGQDLTLADGETLTIDFDGTNGVFKIE